MIDYEIIFSPDGNKVVSLDFIYKNENMKCVHTFDLQINKQKTLNKLKVF